MTPEQKERLEAAVDFVVYKWGWPQDPYIFAERLVFKLRGLV